MKAIRHQIIVIGCGSIGERHIRTFLATGRADVVACDNRQGIREQIAEKYEVGIVEDWNAALGTAPFSAAVIATPAPLHIAMALRALQSNCHVLIEKPLALELSEATQLPAARDHAEKFVAVAYVNHCQGAVQAAREFIRSNAFGAVRHVTMISGHHFPSARPAYREIYYRDHRQGGGAIQDALTHLANAAEWIVGPTTRVYCDAAHQVLEGVAVEDTVNVAARNGDILVNYALNQFQAPHEVRWDFHSEMGSVRIEFQNERWGILPRGAGEWKWHAVPVANRDAMYIAQAHAFLDGCEGKPHPLCTLEDGIQTLRFNLAALRSWRENRPIEL